MDAHAVRGRGDAPARGVQTLTLTTLQQVGLTMVRFGLPVLVPFVRDAPRLSLVQAGIGFPSGHTAGSKMVIRQSPHDPAAWPSASGGPACRSWGRWPRC